MTTIDHTTTSEAGTHALGVALGRALRAGDVVGLVGELGAGKTRLVRGIAEGVGHETGKVSSPTYVLLNEYDAPGATPILHIDAYRIGSPDELRDAGYDHAAPGAIVLIEWADRLEGELTDGALRVEIEHAPGVTETTRRFEFSGPSALIERVAPALSGALESAAGEGMRCPACKAPVPADALTAPFCSQRCRMMDLGAWMRGDYVISRELKETDLDELD